MKNIAVVNGIALSGYAARTLKNGKTSAEIVAEFAGSLPGVEKIVLLTDSENLENDVFPEIIIIENLVQSLLATMQKVSKGFNHIFYFYADTPCLDPGLAEKMYKNHLQYFADYSFADGYPGGVSCEILTTKVVPQLIKLGAEGVVNRDSLFEIIKKDINSFDIETEISPRDLRMLRVNLRADSRRNFLLLEKIVPVVENAAQIIEVLEKQASLLRTLPVYFCIQIIRDCPQDCSYCPYPTRREGSDRAKMTLEQFQKILEKISVFCEDAVINISLWGDAALHPQLEDFFTAVMAYKKFSLIVETAGIGWKTELLTALQAAYQQRITWIVSLDAYEEVVYRKLRGDGYAEANATARKLLELFPQTAYIQAVRMTDNEDDLEKFYASWKEETENIIIQKYDHYCEAMPQKKVTDLSPVNRFPCWHLKRDVYILLDGSIPLCREDLMQEYTLGNIFKDDLDIIWNNGESIYTEHLEGKYNTLCEKCDEYYTYNF